MFNAIFCDPIKTQNFKQESVDNIDNLDVIIDKLNTLEHRTAGWQHRKGYEVNHGFVTSNFA